MCLIKNAKNHFSLLKKFKNTSSAQLCPRAKGPPVLLLLFSMLFPDTKVTRDKRRMERRGIVERDREREGEGGRREKERERGEEGEVEEKKEGVVRRCVDDK